MKLHFIFAFLALVAASFLVSQGLAEDTSDCEVCVKVVDDIKASLTDMVASGKKKNKDTAISAVEKHCSKKTKKSNKDKKLCYNVLPMKNDVARQIAIGKDSLRICKSLSKGNPDFCSMRYPIKTSADTDYSKMRVKKLKQILAERGVECRGCLEKNDYIKRVKETDHMEL